MKVKLNLIIKRLFTLLLAVLMIVQVPLTALADTPGGSHGSQISVSYPGGAGSKGNGTGATAPIYRDYGFRVTISTSKQLQNAISALSGEYTREQLTQQRDDVKNYLSHVYYEPGNDGIYFWARLNRNIKPTLGVVSSYPGDGMPIKSSRLEMPENGTTVTDKDNKLAWMCYEGISGGTRDTDTPYVQEMGDAVKNATTTYGDGGDFLYHLKTLYMRNAGLGSDTAFNDHIIKLMTKVVSNGDNTAQNIRNFSWDTELNQGAGVEVTALDLVYWSQLGYLTMLIQFAWLAQATGNASTYEEFKNYIWTWVQGKDTNVLETMPILVIEACQEIDKTGLPSNSEANTQLVTLPYTMSTNYGTDVVQSMYLGWDTGKPMMDALCEFVGTRAPVNSAVVGQGLGKYFVAGIQKGPTGGANWGGREFCRLLYPSNDRNASFGYLIGFTYAAQSIPPTGTGTNNNAPVPGSFTWKLTPNGAHDMTPDTEVNESSTVYEINVSQNGYNQNNIDKWKTYIAQNGNNNNRMRITVYRVPEDLADTKASQYTREQVMQQGKNATEGFDRVIVGDAKITGLPNATSGTESGTMTNEELINILNTGTGLAMTSETIKGSLEQGIRVTYAVRVEVKVGNKAWQDFTNNQAEWVEYRSTPGTYEYTSDAPDGYAEIKCGYFSTDAYKEPYEAMSGLPTTENLYFVSGGQEFVAQLKYEYETDKSALRNFEQKYQGTQCEGYWEPSTKHFDNATVGEIQEWMNQYTKVQHEDGSFINAKRCSVCGTLHTNGTGNEHIIATEYEDIVSDSDKLDPGDYYTELHLKAVAWDWVCDGGSDEHDEGTDENGEEITVSCDIPSGFAHDVAEQPDDNECDYDGTHTESWYRTKVTRYTGDVVSYHVHYENGDGHQTNLGAIRWTQSYTGMNYAKIKEAHVWRLEQSKVNGIRQITFEDDDTVTGTGKELADVIFNVAESDTAKEGRMWYSIHPEDNDNYVGKLQLATRGCCHCFNHNAAEDLIASKDDPNQIFENAWCISEIVRG